MTVIDYISPNISPRILQNIATLYTDPQRVIMEFVDNSIDSAEEYYQREQGYEQPIKVIIELHGVGKKSQIVITDNCSGMDENGLLRIIQEIGNSDKKEQPWTNGQFGYGIYSFMAICGHIDIISKSDVEPPLKIELNRDEFEKDHLQDVRLMPPVKIGRHEIPFKTGTKVVLSNFDKEHLKSLNLDSLRSDIELHFEQLLARDNIEVIIGGESEESKTNVLSFDYDAFEGDEYKDVIEKLETEPNSKGAVSLFPLDVHMQVHIKFTKGKDINKRPMIISRGRRISEIKDLRSFKSKNKQIIWNHPNLTGFVDVGIFLDPTIARTDFRNTRKSKALFHYLLQLELLIEDLIANINMGSEQEHYKALEDSLNRALSRLAKLDIIGMRFRTEAISGGDFPLKEGSEGMAYGEDTGGKDKGGDGGGGDQGIGENEGEDIGPSGDRGDLPGEPDGGDKPIHEESDSPFTDSDKDGREVRKSGFNVRIVDRDPDTVEDSRKGEKVLKRSHLAGNTIEIFRSHPDFKARISKMRTGAPKISQRLITYLAGEMTVHYEDMYHNKMGQPQYGKQMFVDLTNSIYFLEDVLSPLAGRNLSDLESDEE